MSDRVDHARVERLISVRALGGLHVEDDLALEREMAEHGPGCEECRRLQDEYAEVAGRLAFALLPEPIPAGLEEDLVARATGNREPTAMVVPPAPLTQAPPLPSEQRPGKHRAGSGLWRGIAAVAAALVLFFGGWVVRDQTGPDSGFDVAAARIVAFEGESGELAIAYQPGERGAVLVGSRLPDPGEGRVYELWMVRDGVLIPGGCPLLPSASGTIATYVDSDLGATDSVALTQEPADCPAQPTTEPFLTADLTPRSTA